LRLERPQYSWRRSFSISSLKWLIRASVLDRSGLGVGDFAWADCDGCDSTGQKPSDRCRRQSPVGVASRSRTAGNRRAGPIANAPSAGLGHKKRSCSRRLVNWHAPWPSCLRATASPKAKQMAAQRVAVQNRHPVDRGLWDAQLIIWERLERRSRILLGLAAKIVA
jgi:hypothetical protein